jgi:hypothetical protein
MQSKTEHNLRALASQTAKAYDAALTAEHEARAAVYRARNLWETRALETEIALTAAAAADLEWEEFQAANK